MKERAAGAAAQRGPARRGAAHGRGAARRTGVAPPTNTHRARVEVVAAAHAVRAGRVSDALAEHRAARAVVVRAAAARTRHAGAEPDDESGAAATRCRAADRRALERLVARKVGLLEQRADARRPLVRAAVGVGADGKGLAVGARGGRGERGRRPRHHAAALRERRRGAQAARSEARSLARNAQLAEQLPDERRRAVAVVAVGLAGEHTRRG